MIVITKTSNLTEDVNTLANNFSEYELYQLLEDNGYKTTEENLRIISEGLENGTYSLVDSEILDEFIINNLRKKRELKNKYDYDHLTKFIPFEVEGKKYEAKMPIKPTAQQREDRKTFIKREMKGFKSTNKDNNTQTKTDKKIFNSDSKSFRANSKKVLKSVNNIHAGEAAELDAILNNNTKKMTKAKTYTDNARKATKKGASYTNKNRNSGAKQTGADKRAGLKESYSEYELYQILESNGYKTTEENLRIISEGLENGTYSLVAGETLDETFISTVGSTLAKPVAVAVNGLKDVKAGIGTAAKFAGTHAGALAAGATGIGLGATLAGAHMLKKKIKKKIKGNGITESVENSYYSEYELYQILESNGYKTTRANLDILTEGLESGKYYIDEE